MPFAASLMKWKINKLKNYEWKKKQKGPGMSTKRSERRKKLANKNMYVLWDSGAQD